MGPRPFGRGRYVLTTMFSHHPELQWGRDLSVAEGRFIFAPAARRLLLQWGRDLSVAEGLWGVRTAARLICFNGAATFRSRKGRNRSEASRSGTGLQWGRDLSVAEGDFCRERVAEFVKLQWGRDLSVAEGAEIPAANGSGAAGFNGAATFRSRKVGQPRKSGGRPSRFNGAATFRSRKAPLL